MNSFTNKAEALRKHNQRIKQIRKEKEMKRNEQTHELDNAEVGDGATYTVYSDSKAGTIIKRTAKTITWQRDKATLLNGFDSDADDKLVAHPGGFAAHVSGVQRYDYERDPNGSIVKFSRREITNPYTGKTRIVWKLVGHGSRSPGCSLVAGRHERYDYNF